ncbi:MAG: hypothetical protein ABDI19_10755 [Armatimonadota bacterium]
MRKDAQRMLMVAAMLVGMLSTSLPSLKAMDKTSKSYTWELVPMIVAAPGETLFFMTTTPIPAYHEITSEWEVVRRPLWRALGGRIVFMNDEWVVYRAPKAEGVYLVYWENADRTRRFGFFVSVKEDPTGDQTLPWSEFEGYRGAFVPLTNGSEAPTAIFLARHRVQSAVDRRREAPPNFMDSEGDIEIDLPNKPFNPRPSRRPCSGFTTTVSVHTEDSRWRELAGEIEITASLAAELGRIGIQGVAVGRLYVYADWRRVARFRKIDCYRCVNNQWRWVGSRVEYEVCTYLVGYTPSWICRAVEHGLLQQFICPEEPTYERHCSDSGQECKCPPDSPILTDRYYDPCREMTGK